MQIQVLRVLLDARDTRGQSLTTAVRLCGHPRCALGLAPHGYRRDGYAHAWCLCHFVMHAQCTRCMAAWHVRVGMRVDIHADEACEITQNTVYRIYTVGIRYS